nr:FtsX-like permease family protein [Sporohalobacter salinus]
MRNKLRTSISILAIALSVALVVFVKGLVVGMIDNMFALHIQYKAGHAKIINQEYQQKERLLSLNYPVDGFNGEGISNMEQKLTKIDGVKRTLPRIKFRAAVIQDQKDELVRLMGWGVQPDKELEFTNIENKLTDGRMVKQGQKEVVLGKDLLQKLNLDVGEKITFLYQTSFGSFRGSTFKIVGQIDSGLKLLDKKAFYLPLDQTQRMLEMPGMATELLIETTNYRKIDQIMPKVKEVFKKAEAAEDYQIISWNRGYDMINMLQIAQRIYNFVYIFLIILAGIVVVNTMIMIVKERTKEIGMMTALGLKNQEILTMFIMEGTVMGLVGSLVGVIIGGTVTKIIAITEIIDYSAAMSGVSENILLNPVVRPVVSGKTLIYSFILGVVVTALTCILPARKAAKLKPADALRTT